MARCTSHGSHPPAGTRTPRLARITAGCRPEQHRLEPPVGAPCPVPGGTDRRRRAVREGLRQPRMVPRGSWTPSRAPGPFARPSCARRRQGPARPAPKRRARTRRPGCIGPHHGLAPTRLSHPRMAQLCGSDLLRLVRLQTAAPYPRTCRARPALSIACAARSTRDRRPALTMAGDVRGLAHSSIVSRVRSTASRSSGRALDIGVVRSPGPCSSSGQFHVEPVRLRWPRWILRRSSVGFGHRRGARGSRQPLTTSRPDVRVPPSASWFHVKRPSHPGGAVALARLPASLRHTRRSTAPTQTPDRPARANRVIRRRQPGNDAHSSDRDT
jgi:hypothetical protein